MQHDLATALDEVRHAADLDATPSEDGLPPEVRPEEVEPLGLDGLELREVGKARDEAGLLQVRVDHAPPDVPVALLLLVEPELGPSLHDGSDDVATATESITDPDEAITPGLTHEGHVLRRPAGCREDVSPLPKLPVRESGD